MAELIIMTHSFLTLRVWRLSNKNIWITALCVSLVALLVCSVGNTHIVLSGYWRVRMFDGIWDLQHCSGENLPGVDSAQGMYPFCSLHLLLSLIIPSLQPLNIAINALAAAGDISIALSLVYLLRLSRTRAGFKHTRRTLDTLTVFTISTGGVTAFCAVASLINILAWGHTFIYMAWFFCQGRLYANSLLAALNARRRFRDGFDESTVHTTGENSELGREITFRHTSPPVQMTTGHGAESMFRTAKESVIETGGVSDSMVTDRSKASLHDKVCLRSHMFNHVANTHIAPDDNKPHN